MKPRALVGDGLHHAAGGAVVMFGDGDGGGKGKLGQIFAAPAEGRGVGGLDDHAAALGGMHAHLGAQVAHRFDVVHQLFKVGLIGGVVQRVGEPGPLLDHDALAGAGKRMVNLFGDEGHEGVQQLERLGEGVDQHLAGGVRLFGSEPFRRTLAISMYQSQ